MCEHCSAEVLGTGYTNHCPKCLWSYALMDYGAMLKASVPNPNQRSKHYTKQPKFAGSNRQIRGRILKYLVSNREVTTSDLIKYLADPRAEKNLLDLIKEGFIKEEGELISLS